MPPSNRVFSLLVISLSSLCAEAFLSCQTIQKSLHKPSIPTRTPFSSTHTSANLLFMDASTAEPSQSQTDATATTTVNLPNWRTFSLPIEGDEQSQANITAHLQERAPWSKSAYDEALALYDKFVSCSDSYVAPGIREALNALDHAYRLYGPHSVICSFNGGKDAVVILQLMRAAHAHYYRQQQQTSKISKASSVPVRPRALYFEHADEFPQVLTYLQSCVRDCDLDFVAFEKGIKFNQGLEVLVHSNLPPESSVVFPMAFVLGTRAGDPNAGDQGYFAPSSHYMPPFMRVNPVLEWTYGQVWHFLRVFSVRQLVAIFYVVAI